VGERKPHYEAGLSLNLILYFIGEDISYSVLHHGALRYSGHIKTGEPLKGGGPFLFAPGFPLFKWGLIHQGGPIPPILTRGGKKVIGGVRPPL